MKATLFWQTARYFYIVVGQPGIKVSHFKSKPNRDCEHVEDSVSVNTAAELKRAGVSPAFKCRRRWRHGLTRTAHSRRRTQAMATVVPRGLNFARTCGVRKIYAYDLGVFWVSWLS